MIEMSQLDELERNFSEFFSRRRFKLVQIFIFVDNSLDCSDSTHKVE